MLELLFACCFQSLKFPLDEEDSKDWGTANSRALLCQECLYPDIPGQSLAFGSSTLTFLKNSLQGKRSIQNVHRCPVSSQLLLAHKHGFLSGWEDDRDHSSPTRTFHMAGFLTGCAEAPVCRFVVQNLWFPAFGISHCRRVMHGCGKLVIHATSSHRTTHVPQSC